MDSYSGIIIEESRRSEQFSDFTPIPCKGFNILCKAKRYGRWWVLKGLKEPYRQDENYKNLLHKEFDILISLQHPNIVSAYSMEEIPEMGTCIVMEWIDGITLEHWSGRKTEGEDIFLQLLDAVHYIHAKRCKAPIAQRYANVDELKADFMAHRNRHLSGIKRIGIAALACIILLGFISYPLLHQQEKSISIIPEHIEAKKDTSIRQQTKKPAPLSNARKSLQPTATEPSSASHLQSAELISKGKKTIDKMWKESGIDTIRSVVKKSEAYFLFVNKSNEFITTTYPQTFSKDIDGKKADIIYELSSYTTERYVKPTLSSFQSSK